MNDPSINLNYADKFEGPITRLLANTFKVSRQYIELPSDFQDRKKVTDFTVKVRGEKKRIAARIRRADHGNFFNKDFTLRESFKNNNDVITEMEKVFHQGLGDIFIYGIGDDEFNLSAYRICDLAVLRRDFVYDKNLHTVRSRATGKVIGYRKANDAEGDSYFWTFPWVDMPDDFFIVGTSPMPRRPDPKKLEQEERALLCPMFA